MFKHYDELIEIMEEVKHLIRLPNTDISWSQYNSIDDLLKDLMTYTNRLGAKDETVIDRLKFLFAPTSEFQDIAIDSGWSDKYFELSTKFEKLVLKIK
jgi:hypothetical protein